MVEIEPIRVEVEREDDGRVLASAPDLPGVMADGNAEDEAIRRVKSIALQVLADMVENGEDIPDPLKVRFAA
jgi:predicted RNase H-like HicB family nuclease